MSAKIGAMRLVDQADEKKRYDAARQSEMDWQLVERYIADHPQLPITQRFIDSAREVSALKDQLKTRILNLRRLERAILLVADQQYV